MKTFRLLSYFIAIILLGNMHLTSAANYTWTGNTSTAWNVASNWSPSSGFPGSSDNVTIVSATNQPQLDQNRSINALTVNSGTLDLNSYTLTVNGNANLNSGTVQNGILKPRGNQGSFAGTQVNCKVDAVCGSIKLSGGVFNNVCYFEDLSQANSAGDGGCTFNDSLTIKHTGTNGKLFKLAITNGDVYNGPVTLINESDYEIWIAIADSNYFNDNIIVNNTGSDGITFGINGGYSELASGKTISVGSVGFTKDILTLHQFYQIGSTSQSLSLTDSASVTISYSEFNGPLTISAPGFLIKNNIFNGATSFTKTGTSNYHSYGGNVFNGYPNLVVNSGTNGRIRLATNSGDIFNDDITFQTSGQAIQIGYTGDNYFKGNISINNNNILFNSGDGNVILAGPPSGTGNPYYSLIQELNGNVNYSFSNLTIDHNVAGYIVANTTLSVDGNLKLSHSTMKTTIDNLLTMKAGSSVDFYGSNSFIDGPVKKVGNTDFDFPIGKSNKLKLLSITAPSNATDSYIAEYFDFGQTFGEFLDSTLAYIDDCNYWMFLRNSGTSDVKITLHWNKPGCSVVDTSYLKIAHWEDTNWKDLGHGSISTGVASGTITSLYTINDYGYFTFAYDTSIIQHFKPDDYYSGNGFVENIGQLIGTDSLKHPEILYFGFAGNSDIFFSDSSIFYVFSHTIKTSCMNSEYVELSAEDSLLTLYNQTDSLERIEMKFINYNSEINIIGSDTSQGYFNYFLGYLDTSYVIANTYQVVTYENIFENIDLAFYNNDEIRFYLQPEASVDDILFYYSGVDSISIDTLNHLNIFTAFEDKTYQIIAYENIDNIWTKINSEFNLLDSILSISIGTHQNVEIMIKLMPSSICSDIWVCPESINPQNLNKWCTFYGKGFDNQMRNIEIDDDNHFYVINQTRSSIFPVINNIFGYSGLSDVIISSFAPNRSRIFSTYWGGSSWDTPISMNIDKFGNVAVVGETTSSDFYQCIGCSGHQQSYTGSQDGFLIKLDPNGYTIYMSTLFASSGATSVWGVDFDSQNNMIIAGYSTSNNLPLPNGSNLGYVQSFPTNPPSNTAGFISKFDSDNELIWRTYFGGKDFDYCKTVVVDNNDNFYVCGYTLSEATNLLCSPCSTNASQDFPVCGPIGSTTYLNSGSWDSFFSCFNSSNYLIWSTLFGGSGDDRFSIFGNSIDCSPTNNNLIFAGITNTNNSVATNLIPLLHIGSAVDGYFDDTFHGGTMGLLLMFNSSFALNWATYIGDVGTDNLISIDVNDDGKFYVCGSTNSTYFPVHPSSNGAFYDSAINANGSPGSIASHSDGIILRFSNDYKLIYSTFFGGDDNDFIIDISFQDASSSNQHNVVFTGGYYNGSHLPDPTFPLKDIPGPIDYFDTNPISSRNYMAQPFIGNFYNVSTPFRFSQTEPIEQLNNLQFILIAPNPFLNQIIIQSLSAELKELTIFDITGKQLFALSSINEFNRTLDLGHLSSGIYILSVKDINGRMVMKKIIKQ